MKVPRGAGEDAGLQFFARLLLKAVEAVVISVLGLGIGGKGHKILDRSEPAGSAADGGEITLV